MIARYRGVRMADIHAPPQPGSPQQAHRILPLGTFGSYLLLGGIFCVIATLGFVRLADEVFENELVAIDNGIITWIHAYWGPASDQVMLFFTTMGESVVLGLFIGLAVIGLRLRGRWIDALGLILAGAGAGIVNQLLKATYQRVRPDLFPGPFHLTSYSFPSGHSMGAIACYGMLAFVAIRLVSSRWSKIAIGIAATLIVLCVGISRVYFGVHYPTDVLGGFIAGAIWLIITIVLVQLAESYARRRQATRARS
jgi:undecaprenyl-diphosphatase